MNFFAQQDRARKQTWRLLWLLLFAVIIIIAVTDLVVTLGAYFLLDTPLVWGWFSYQVFDGVLLLAIVIFALRRLYQLRGGGESIARMVKARQVLRNASSLEEKRLLNVVDEMAIAAGVAVPSVWVMDKEDGINAFAAGYSPNQAVIVVTSGALAQLKREELQGVIGHEFGHILNGDMRLNVKLIGILAGIVVVGEAGLLVIRLGASADDGAFAIIPFGAFIAAVGYIGVFCGRMIKAAVSRQREFLADASSVQFTRNPDGLVSALEKIRHGNGTLIKNAYAGEMSHMFFGQSFVAKVFADQLATHPSIDERLASLGGRALQAPAQAQPQASITAAFLAWGKGLLAPVLEPASDTATTPTPAPAAVTPDSDGAMANFAGDTAPTILARVGQATPQHVELASELLAAMPGALRQSLNTPPGARCAVYAYLMSSDAAVLAIQMRTLAQADETVMATQLTEVTMALQALGPKARLTVLALALPALRQMTQTARDVFLRAVDELVLADQQTTLSEFVLQTILHWQLSAKATRAEPVRSRTLASVTAEIVLLLTTLARAGSADPKAQAFAFARGMGRLNLSGEMPAAARLDAKVLSAALTRLRQLTPMRKPPLILACVDTALADRALLVAEFELLRTIGMAIDCPMPPLLASQAVS